MAIGKPLTRLDSYRLVRFALLFFYIQSVLLGFIAQVYDSSKNKIYTSKIFAVYSAGISIVLIVKHVTPGNVLNTNSELSIVESGVNGVEAFLLLNIMALGTVRRYTSRQVLGQIFDDFVSIQKAIGYSSEQVYSAANKKVLKVVTTGSVLFIILIMLEARTVTTLPEAFDLFRLMYPKAMIVNLASWYYLEVLYVHRFFEIINLMLSELYQEVARNPEKHIDNPSWKLHRIMKMRKQIIALAFRINNHHNLQMLTVFTLISLLTLNQVNR